jgi:thiamine biosynthesis protein ThiS
LAPEKQNEAPEKQIRLNGETRSFPLEATLLDLLSALALDPERVAIELNRSIVKRDQWALARFESGSEIEIVQFVGGG